MQAYRERDALSRLIGKQLLETREVVALGQTVVVISLCLLLFVARVRPLPTVTNGDISKMSYSRNSAWAEIAERLRAMTRFPAKKINTHFRNSFKNR